MHFAFQRSDDKLVRSAKEVKRKYSSSSQ